MSSEEREKRKAIFEDTMRWIESDKRLSESVARAKQNTHVYYEDDYPVFYRPELPSMNVEVTPDRSFQAAMRLRKEYPEARIAVMNFANAFKPGGGVENGSSAQEECLCRTSTLYPVINDRNVAGKYYKHHKELNTAKASDSLIYTEGVVICKTDTAFPERMPPEQWENVDVITVAAPDLRVKSNKHFDLINGGVIMKNAELFGYHVKRAIHIFTCAAAQGADILVLGAFGCGAFENEPEVVARAYKVALSEFPNVFTKVEFAIYCPPKGSKNYEVFKRVMEEV